MSMQQAAKVAYTSLQEGVSLTVPYALSGSLHTAAALGYYYYVTIKYNDKVETSSLAIIMLPISLKYNDKVETSSLEAILERI